MTPDEKEEHDAISTAFALRILAHLQRERSTTARVSSTLSRMNPNPLACELCARTDLQPVRDRDRPTGMVVCPECRVVYLPEPAPPAMGRTEPGPGPDLSRYGPKTGR